MPPAHRNGTAIVWFRRDLRLADHPPLSAAVSRFDRVVPLFVWDPVLIDASGDARLAFIAACVRTLRETLGRLLVVRAGEPALVVAHTAKEVGATAVFASADYAPYGSGRDRRVTAALPTNVEMTFVDSPYAVTPGSLLTSAGSPFQVFTPFARAWRQHLCAEPLPQPSLSKVTRAGLSDSNLPPRLSARPPSMVPPGESAAHRRLDSFLDATVRKYGDERDRPDLSSTSGLSPYLKTGCIHPRQVLSRLEPGDPGSDSFRNELCWREFFADLLFHRPDAARHPYRPGWERLQVDTGPSADEVFDAWTHGQTGYPIVDAGMRQLLSEGWMPNRVRMVAASFLIKDLHLDWRRGAKWFMQHLTDADLASNQLNWQWVAGSGTDAAPFFRVFNPTTQSQKFDPDGHYIRRWVPELEHLESKQIHDPWRSGDRSPYPRPIVDHDHERRVALARFDRLRHESAKTSTR